MFRLSNTGLIKIFVFDISFRKIIQSSCVFGSYHIIVGFDIQIYTIFMVLVGLSFGRIFHLSANSMSSIRISKKFSISFQCNERNEVLLQDV